jgi:drug/metabolite transporter (DMT)-like permease
VTTVSPGDPALGTSAGTPAAADPVAPRPPSASEAPSDAYAGAVMLVIVLIWGLGPPVTKLITAPPLVAVSLRFWLSIPIVWAIAYLSGRRISRQVLRRTALAGALFGVNLAFVFAALQHASVAVLSVIQALQPGVVLLVASPWLGERATRWHVFWTGVGVLGVGVVILGGNPEVRGDAVGIAFAVGSMLTFTTYYLINRRVRATTAIDPIEWMAGVTLFAGLAITPVALATSSLDDYRQMGRADWLYLIFVAGMVGIVGHTMMSWAHKFIPATRSSLCLLGMNVVAIAAAWPLHDEPITWLQVAGGLVVLGAVAAVVSRPASVRVSTSPPSPALAGAGR